MPLSPVVSFTNLKCETMDGRVPVIAQMALPPSIFIAHGTIVAQITADLPIPTACAYSSGNSPAGANVAVGIMLYDVHSDSAGNIHYCGASLLPDEFAANEGPVGVPVIIGNGSFNVADLIGLDATAAAALGRIAVGNTTAGILELM
jgi:hypothetical protein